MTQAEAHSIPTLTHGRMLVRAALAGRSRGVLVGFHGYMENAAVQLARLEQLPGSSAWTLASIQGLHRFYRGRSQEVVASWMTSEDRETAIADNLSYVAAALDAVPHDASTRLCFIGFSQGVAMAFRAAARGPHRATAVIAVGGDVPPELVHDRTISLPRVLLARGDRDDWYTAGKHEADVQSLTARNVPVHALVYDGPHEWTPGLAGALDEFLASVDRSV